MTPSADTPVEGACGASPMTHSSQTALVLLAASATVQSFAVVAALRLVAITRLRAAWGAVAVAMAMMAAHRALPLWHALAHGNPPPADLPSQVLGLGVSVVLCGGLILLGHVARLSRVQSSQLETTAERYRAVFERHPAAMLLIDPSKSEIVDANPAAAAFYGYARERLRHVPLSMLEVETDAPREPVPAPWQSGQPQIAHHRLASGEVREVEIRAGVFDSGSGRLLCAFVHDEHDRLSAEREQAEQAALSEHNPAPTLRVDRSGVVVLANPAARAYGIEVGRPLAHAVEAFGRVDVATVIEHGRTHVLEARVRDRSLRLTVKGLASKAAASVYTSDVTDLKHAQDALRASNEDLRRWVNELERHRQDSEAHIELTALLQSCESVQEAGHVIERLVPTLFPASSGAICLDVPGTSALQCIGDWGERPPATSSFHRDACWAVRRGQLHAAEAVQGGLACPHLMDGFEGYSVCLPLRAQGTMPGVLTLRGDHRLREQGGLRQARMLADTVGLAIVNLRLRESLREQSIRDGLTGLFNRRYLEETLARELARASREQTSLSLLMVDLDHFKRVNDTYGHSTGDRVLQTVAELLQRQVRSADIVCRYGGEEFAVLLPDTTLDHALARAEDLREGAQSLEMPGLTASDVMSLSVGVATYPLHGRRAADLVRSSDNALYSAKRNGRNRVETPPLPEGGRVPSSLEL